MAWDPLPALPRERFVNCYVDGDGRTFTVQGRNGPTNYMTRGEADEGCAGHSSFIRRMCVLRVRLKPLSRGPMGPIFSHSYSHGGGTDARTRWDEAPARWK